MTYLESIDTAAAAIRSACGEAEIGLILGSGLAQSIALENARTIAYDKIPGFPVSTAPGHQSEWVCGELGGKRVCLMRGRFHLYEGYPMEKIALPVRVMKRLGVKALIVTNACGGVNAGFTPGDLMLITDTINFSGINPLIGPNEDALGPRFPDMSKQIDRDFLRLAHTVGEEMGIALQEGVYMWFSGPSFETPAEIRMARTLGADAVGMSTVPEIITARHCGIRVLGISCITNLAAGMLDQPLTHEEVLETGARVKEAFAKLVCGIVRKMEL